MNHIIAQGAIGSPIREVQEHPKRALDRISDLERRINSAHLIIEDQVEEVRNGIGHNGVVGYTLSLDEGTTRELWQLLERIP